MKRLPFVFAAVFGMGLVISSLAMARSDNYPNPTDSSVWNSRNADAGMAEPGVVQGTAVTVDPQAGSLTINDLSGAARTFSVMRGEELQAIKPGDKVSVTPDANNASSAQRVQRDAESRP